jgi:hypothetical protein
MSSPESVARRDRALPSRWQQYVELLESQGVPKNARRWYVARVEAFLRAVKPAGLRELTLEAVTGFFEKLSRGAKGARLGYFCGHNLDSHCQFSLTGVMRAGIVASQTRPATRLRFPPLARRCLILA